MSKTSKRVALLFFASLVLLVPAASASAAAWSLSFDHNTNTYLAPGEEVAYFLNARNIGTTSTGAGPENATRIVVELPPGVTATAAGDQYNFNAWACSGIGTSTVSCLWEIAPTEPGKEIVLPLYVDGVLDPGASPGTLPPATAEIAGGGGEGDANVPTLPDGTTPCGYAGSPTPFEPPCASAVSKTIQIDSAPEFGIRALDTATSANQAGDPFFQAGGHPYEISTEIAFDTDTHPTRGPSWPVEPVKDVLVDLPPGFVGYPVDTARCTLAELAPTLPQVESLCAAESQVGVGSITIAYGNGVSAPLTGQVQIYNMVPPPGVPARFAMRFAGVIVSFDFELRSGSDYGLSVNVRNASQGLALIGSKVRIWGFPAEAIHDPERKCPNSEEFGCASSADPEEPFLRMPTSCTPAGTGLASAAHADSWFDPAPFNPDGTPNLADPRWKSRTVASHDPPGYPAPEAQWGPERGTEGCEQVPFDPSISIKPTTQEADSPTGLEVDLSIPQEDVGGIAPSDLKEAKVVLPQGMTVNASSVQGLGACAPEQIALRSASDANCPQSSKIGSVAIDTPMLEAPLQGSVYLASQGNNPFGSLLALYIAAEGPGLNVKLAGKVEPRADGTLVTTFTDQPQLPFSKLHLELDPGPRAPLINPRTCGTHTANATLAPWSGKAPSELRSSFELTSGPGGGPCPSGGFDPKLSAGTESPIAATYTPFSLRLWREDGTSELTGLSLRPPPGLLAKLAGIPYCPEAALASVSTAAGSAAAQLAAPACPPASRIGSVFASAGAGSSPFSLDTGRAYLAGPYKGAPLSIAILTPALAGPFDLGNVLVRTALHIDPATTQLTAVSDPLPTALHGIALNLREVRVALDRPQFTLNPTSCDPTSIEAQIAGTGGASAERSVRFQLANCANLAFKPRLRFSLAGKTARGGHPRLRATVRTKAREANIARAAVTLPRATILDQGHIRTVCTRPQFSAGSCPKGSIYGNARAWSPLLDQPLQGPVYLRSNGGERQLPDLVASLEGQIKVELAGYIDAVKGKLRSRFAFVPDAPVSKFVLTMKGGRKGLLVNSTNLCATTQRATVKMDAHNGKVRDSRPKLAVRCAKKQKRRGKGGR